MSWTHKTLILPGALLVACSVLNQFDDVGEILPDGGSGGSTAGSGGSDGGAGGSSGGSSSGGSAGKGGSKATGGEAGGGPDEPLVGAIVVGQRVGTGTQAKNHIIVIDPADGSEVGRKETELQIHAIGYEAPRDKWFVFTGTTGAGGPANVIVGHVNRSGFVQEGMTIVPDGKPTGQSTMTVLNRRILYRTVQSDGSTTPDKLVLLDTEDLTDLSIIGSLDIPPINRVFATLGRPNSAAPGGRVRFIHFNRTAVAQFPMSECMDVGSETVCPVKTSSIGITANVTNPDQPPPPVIVAMVGQSGSNPSGATELRTNGFDYIVVPPAPGAGSMATAYKYDASSNMVDQVSFDLGTLQVASVSMSATVIDPCIERVVTSEHANTKSIYAVPFADPNGAVTVPLNAPAGTLAYEPYTKTVIQAFQDAASPSFRGFVLGGTAEAPTLTERGTGGASLPWLAPADLNPAIVATKNPLVPPCN